MAAKQKQAKVIKQSNISQFFNTQSFNLSLVKPGMLLSFRYSSPDGVHDPTPLVYVLKKDKDRIWGLNIHYNFTLIAQIYNLKQLEVNQDKKEIKPTTQTPNPKANEDVLTKVPKLKSILSKTKSRPTLSKPKEKKQPVTSNKKFNIKTNLDIFVLKQQPEYILRNYLFSRIKSGKKLIYKVT